MKVSIVTVSFNSAPTIEETIRSVLSQEGVEVEYIVVDGASQDGTADIIRQYEARLAWWVSEPDGGQVDALNKGFAHATGEVLGFLNADDVLLPGTLKKVRDCFAQQPQTDLVYGEVEWIDWEGRSLGVHAGEISSLEEVLNIFDVWWGERQWVQPEVFYRRELKERVGAFDPRYHLAFDYDFWVRCFLAGAKVARLHELFIRFRRHAGQKSNQTERAVQEIRAILGEHLAARPPLGAWPLAILAARLSYDLYQSSPANARPAFLAALARHPAWWLVPAVRERVRISLFHRPRAL